MTSKTRQELIDELNLELERVRRKIKIADVLMKTSFAFVFISVLLLIGNILVSACGK